MEEATGPRGVHVLLIAEEFFVAIATMEELEALGAVVLGPAASVDVGLSIIRSAAQIDAAILDINLRGELVYPLADALVERDIPFAFATGYDASNVPEKFEHAPLFQKPIDLPKILGALMSKATRH